MDEVGHGRLAQRIAIGSDHAGYDLKQHLVTMLLGQGYEVDDQGTHSTESVDYPEICAGVGRTVRDGDADLGIVLGGSGQGEQLAANKVRGVRAALCNCLYTARMARSHNDANVLSIGARRGGGGARRGDRPDVPDHCLRGGPPRPPCRPARRSRSPVLNPLDTPEPNRATPRQHPASTPPATPPATPPER